MQRFEPDFYQYKVFHCLCSSVREVCMLIMTLATYH